MFFDLRLLLYCIYCALSYFNRFKKFDWQTNADCEFSFHAHVLSCTLYKLFFRVKEVKWYIRNGFLSLFHVAAPNYSVFFCLVHIVPNSSTWKIVELDKA